MSNPFESLYTQKPKKEDLEYDEWGGQFDCSTIGCRGWSKVAKYFKSSRMLAWECQEGHVSRLEDVDE